ncbi:MAG: glycine--tRNA ligase subunit beta [Chromatiales bacterium]|nr:glycine--tRNA ligase subunit beta [Chromatiales bacterium]
MAEFRDLLLEIGTEELPPKALYRLAESLANGLAEGLGKAELAHGEVRFYASPRRLAVYVAALTTAQEDRILERRGPAVKAAFDGDGNPSKAAQGFARSCGVEVHDLEQVETEQGAWLVFRKPEQGRATADLLPEMVEAALAKLPIPKRMRWGDGDAEFVRPVHWVLLLLGADVVPGAVLGCPCGRETRGHRFHHPQVISIAEPGEYLDSLKDPGRVIADFGARRRQIAQSVQQAGEDNGGTAVVDPDLLDEVTALVEWPVPIVGAFETRFLDVPQEALISAMKGHQKYFHMVDAEGRLLPKFIAISNLESSRPASIREGNERVIRPRLTDAEFFWKQDRKHGLAAHRDSLGTVVFQNRLGTLADKSDRAAAGAAEIAAAIGGQPDLARRAGELSKCDLMTSMVYEFPELQGIMGRYYAAAEGEALSVALALDEQYLPRFSGDELPSDPVGQSLGLADRLDTLVGIFGIGQRPTGDKDPFALRRAALGVLRILVEKHLDLDLGELIAAAVGRFPAGIIQEDTAETLLDFLFDRLRGYFSESGYAPDEFDSVQVLRPTHPLDFRARLEAVAVFRKLPEAESLAAANKRIRNILRKSGQETAGEIDPGRFQDAAEKALYEQLQGLREPVTRLLQDRRYTEALTLLAGLRESVDRFFDEVMVMAEDEALRNNRLALLDAMSRLFLGVADISRLQS